MFSQAPAQNMLPEDKVRVQHMLDASRDALSFAAGKERSNLDDERQLVLALIKSVEIVGEAASKVSPELRASAPDIPWTDIVGMRNRLIHAYFDIDLDILWQTVTAELPPLKTKLEALLAGD